MDVLRRDRILTNQELNNRLDELEKQVKKIDGFVRNISQRYMELEQEEKGEDTTPDGIVSSKMKNVQNNGYNANYSMKELTGIIKNVDIAMSEHNNLRIMIYVKADDGKTYKMCLTCQEEWPKKYIYLNFMKPFGITTINENSPLSDYEQFPYKNYEGSRVGFKLNEKGEIKSFTRLIPNLDW